MRQANDRRLPLEWSGAPLNGRGPPCGVGVPLVGSGVDATEQDTLGLVLHPQVAHITGGFTPEGTPTDQ